MLTWPPKDPSEVKDYDLVWTGELAGDTILTSSWSIAPGVALIINSNSFVTSATSSITKVWLAAGIAGQTYILKNTVTTAGGRTEDESVSILCRLK